LNKKKTLFFSCAFYFSSKKQKKKKKKNKKTPEQSFPLRVRVRATTLARLLALLAVSASSTVQAAAQFS